MTQAHDPLENTAASFHRRTFHYEAQSPDGHALAGTIEADTVDAAQRSLAATGLRLVELEAQTEATARPRPLRGAEFTAFNQQLAQLTAAGLPVERGLRLIARDMHNARLSQTINAVAAELEQGLHRHHRRAFARQLPKRPSHLHRSARGCRGPTRRHGRCDRPR